MIPAIGTMIGFYIITRMIESFVKNSDTGFLRFMCIVTIFITIFSITDIVNAGSKVTG